MFTILQKPMRSQLVKMLQQSDEPEAIQLANDLIECGQHTEATEDEIEQFMEIS